MSSQKEEVEAIQLEMVTLPEFAINYEDELVVAGKNQELLMEGKLLSITY